MALSAALYSSRERPSFSMTLRYTAGSLVLVEMLHFVQHDMGYSLLFIVILTRGKNLMDYSLLCGEMFHGACP
jgi:hypothetical protein